MTFKPPQKVPCSSSEFPSKKEIIIQWLYLEKEIIPDVSTISYEVGCIGVIFQKRAQVVGARAVVAKVKVEELKLVLQEFSHSLLDVQAKTNE